MELPVFSIVKTKSELEPIAVVANNCVPLWAIEVAACLTFISGSGALTVNVAALEVAGVQGAFDKTHRYWYPFIAKVAPVIFSVAVVTFE